MTRTLSLCAAAVVFSSLVACASAGPLDADADDFSGATAGAPAGAAGGAANKTANNSSTATAGHAAPGGGGSSAKGPAGGPGGAAGEGGAVASGGAAGKAGVAAAGKGGAASGGSPQSSAGKGGATSASAGKAGATSASAGKAGATSASAGDGEGGAQGGGAEPTSGGVAALISEAEYEALFPNRNALFTYQGLVKAAATFPEFANTGTEAQKKRELAAFFANIGHETTGGWPTAPGGAQAWGLYFKQEVGCEGGACKGYCEPTNAKYPCAPGKTYHGRGPIQLSYNYNYGACGDALGVDLLHDPDLVTSSPEVTFRTALWFWMTPQAPKPSAHDVMTGGYQPSPEDAKAGRVEGFGLTIDIINGGVECGYPSPPQVKDRVAFYQKFCATLGVDAGPALECAAMESY